MVKMAIKGNVVLFGRKLPPSTHNEIDKLVRAICAATENANNNIAAHALAFCLFANVRLAYDLSEIETVKFCAKHIAHYGRLLKTVALK
jgi:hypothetical protein